MELTRSKDSSAKKCIKSRSINENRTVFVLYALERIVLQPCEAKVINMQIRVKLPHTINAKIWLLSSIQRENISIESNTLIRDSNTNDFVKMELLNRNFNAKVTIQRNQELAFMTLLYEGKEELNTTYKII